MASPADQVKDGYQSRRRATESLNSFPKERDLGSRLVELGMKPLAADRATARPPVTATTTLASEMACKIPDVTW